MSIDAGTIYSAIRLKLDGLTADINTATGKIESFGKKIEDVGKKTDSMKKFGTNLTLGVTAPIVAASAAMVKFASDQAESLNAANVVFGKSAKTITDWGDKAAKQAGLAKSEFYQASAVIGAGFKNAGYSLDDAANQTINLTQRAADMASIFNTDVNDAMTALQSALRGEYEPARRFAVSLSEAAVSAKAVEMGISKTGKELTNYEKTQARLALIMEQTNQFQGDFVNTSDQLANSTRILQAEVKNEAAEFGKQLLPALLEIIKGARGIVENFSKMDDSTRKTVLTVMAFAAATGPLVIGIAKVIEAAKILQVVMMTLAANPLTLVIAGVALLVAGLKQAGDENNKKMIEEVGETFKNVGELAEVSAQNIVDVEEALARMSRGGGTATELKDSIAQIAADTGLTEEQVLAIGNHSEKTTAEFREQLNLANDLLKTQREQEKAVAAGKAYITGSTEWIAAQAKLQEKVTKEAKEQNTLSAEQQEQIKGRIKAEEEYNAKKEMLDLKRRDNLITETEYTKGIADAQSGYLDTLYELGYAYQSEIGTKGRKAYEEMLAAVKAANEAGRSKEFLESYKERTDAVSELSDTTLSANEKARTQALAELDKLKAVTDEEKKKKQELIDKTNEYYDILSETQAFDTFAKNATTSINAVTNIFSALSSVISALSKAQISALDAEMEERLKNAGLAEKTAVETAQAEYDAAKEGGNATTIEEKKQALERARIKEEYEKKKAKIEYDAAMASWSLQIAMATAQAALAVLNGLQTQPFFPVGIAAGALAGTAGALQVAAVIASKPVPAFEDGGIVPGTSYTGDKVLARLNSGEEVLTMNDPRHALNNGSIGQMSFVFEMDGEVFARASANYYNNGQVRLKIK